MRDDSLPVRASGTMGGTIHVAHVLERVREGEREANAHLIAAAPQLLEACKLFMQAAHEVRDILNGKGFACPASIAYAAEKARNAIAKAERGQ